MHHILQTFSTAERDRRYARVRALMRERGFDAVLALPAEGYESQAHARYLTQIGIQQGGAWALLPLEGDCVAVVDTEREAAMYRQFLAWPTEIRWGDSLRTAADAVHAAGLGSARIGVLGIGPEMHRPRGTVGYGTWTSFGALVPRARFEPANEVVDLARVVKGPEEVAVVARIAEANEAAIGRMAELARPGTTEAALWTEMAKVLLDRTADSPARLSLGSNDRPANASNSVGLDIRLEDGGILSQEIDGKVQGYRAQCNHSMLVGRSERERYRAAMQNSIEIWQHLFAWIRPGRTVRELLAEFRSRLDATGTDFGGGPLVHTSGCGSDRPRVGFALGSEADRDLVIEEGWTFGLKLAAQPKGFRGHVQIGDPIVVERGGARRLGRRALEPLFSA